MTPPVDLEKGLQQSVVPPVHDNVVRSSPATSAVQQRHRWFLPIKRLTWRTSKPILPLHKLGMQGIPRRYSWRWWSALWVSKVDHPSADFVDLPNGFVHGSMSDTDFCQWILSSARPVREAVVCNITWWRANKAPFHHQFIILTVTYRRDATTPIELYDLQLERIGKARSFRGAAEHRITVSKAQHLSHLKLDHTLLFGLLGAGDMLDWETLVTPETFPIQLAFRDELDEKWQGHSATLAQIAAYVEHIVRLAPRYNVTSTNCYYFSRLLMHAVALRHYAFQFIAAHHAGDLQPLSDVHDPSAISSVFHFLKKHERSDGVLIHLRALRLINRSSIVIFIGTYIGVGITLYINIVNSYRSEGGFAAWVMLFPLNAVLLYYTLARISRALLVKPSRIRLSRQTTQLVQTLDDDPTLTHPRGKRGDYIPGTGYRTWKVIIKNRFIRRRIPTIHFTVLSDQDGLRLPVEPWKCPEQCYNGHCPIINGKSEAYFNILIASPLVKPIAF